MSSFASFMSETSDASTDRFFPLVQSVANDGQIVDWKTCLNYSQVISRSTNILHDYIVIRIVNFGKPDVPAYILVPSNTKYVPCADYLIDGFNVRIYTIRTTSFADVASLANDGQLIKWIDCINYEYVITRCKNTDDYVPIRIVNYQNKGVPLYCLVPADTKYIPSSDIRIDGMLVRIDVL